MRILKKRPEPWEKGKTDEGSVGAKRIRSEIEGLSSFELMPIGVAVETGYIPDLKVKSEHLDYAVFYKGEKIAELDPSTCKYTFDGSRIMPVSYYKGDIIRKNTVPSFFVYSMEKEQGALKDRCVWIRGEDVTKSEHHSEFLGGKMQENYFTDKKDWHRGLESLIEELSKIAKGSFNPRQGKQRTLMRKRK